MADSLVFTLAVFTILATPGPTNTLMATAGALRGWRSAAVLVPVEAAAYAVAVLAVGLALGPALAEHPHAAVAIRTGVAVYLMALAVRLWRQGSATFTAGAAVSARQIFVTTLLNPKVLVFALGLIPFERGTEAWAGPFALFVLLVCGVALGWVVLGAALGGAADRGGFRHIVPRAGAAAVAGFAVLVLARPVLG